MLDIAIIIVSHNSARWLRSCLRSVFAHMGAVRADVIVVDSQSSDETEDVVAGEFPDARLVRCSNHGFAHANNRALMICDARYVLFLNPDTQILQGNLSDLVRAMDARLSVGLVGVRQFSGEGRLDKTIRRFPNALRALGDAFSMERLPGRPRWLGERELDLAAYDREGECDWTSGSFMLARREAIESAGFLDERFFMYSEETDLCRRVKTAGMGGAPPSVDDDLARGRDAPGGAENRKPQCLQSHRLRAQALLAGAPDPLLRRRLLALPAAVGMRGPRRFGTAPPAGQPCRAEHAAGPITCALRPAEPLLCAAWEAATCTGDSR